MLLLYRNNDDKHSCEKTGSREIFFEKDVYGYGNCKSLDWQARTLIHSHAFFKTKTHFRNGEPQAGAAVRKAMDKSTKSDLG